MNASFGKPLRSNLNVMANCSTTIGGFKPRTILAVGRNYVAHIKELRGILNLDQDLPKEPMIFLKSGATLVHPGEPIVLPPWSKDVHHEVELAIELGPDLQPVRAAVSIDLTARDVQAQLKAKGHPWSLSKSFPGSCPIGPAFAVGPGTDVPDLQDLTLEFKVNGVVRQRSSTSLMIFSVPQLLEYLKSHFPVEAGDLVLTGTPEGVGQLLPGDEVEARVLLGSGPRVLSEATWKVEAAAGAGAARSRL